MLYSKIVIYAGDDNKGSFAGSFPPEGINFFFTNNRENTNRQKCNK